MSGAFYAGDETARQAWDTGLGHAVPETEPDVGHALARPARGAGVSHG